jgi:mitogen-activated protein kinase kinase kinase
MVTGLRPWSGIDNEWAIMYKIAQGNQPSFTAIDQLSDTGVDFIKRCFELDPVRRPSAAELLQHEWIVTIRRQVVAEPQTPSSSDTGSSASSTATSRQNSTYS